jgi:ABC-type Fe3+/spermidine/putrescine transport system ATPase subunit
MLILHAGKIIQDGTPQEVYRYPQNAYAAGLLGKYNTLTEAQAAAFGLPANATQMLRPEEIRMVPTGSGNISATIQSVQFYGAYYELQLVALDGSLIVRCGTSINPAAGQKWDLALTSG